MFLAEAVMFILTCGLLSFSRTRSAFRKGNVLLLLTLGVLVTALLALSYPLAVAAARHFQVPFTGGTLFFWRLLAISASMPALLDLARRRICTH
jgi:hypothetical protein